MLWSLDVCVFHVVVVCQGFEGKWTFFVNKTSFEELFRMMGFTHFLNMAKNAMIRGCSCFSCFLCSTWWKVIFFVNEAGFEKLLKVTGFTYVSNMVTNAIVCWCLCFFFLVFFYTISTDSELFVDEISFEKLLRTMGFAYVF